MSDKIRLWSDESQDTGYGTLNNDDLELDFPSPSDIATDVSNDVVPVNPGPSLSFHHINYAVKVTPTAVSTCSGCSACSCTEDSLQILHDVRSVLWE